MLIIPRDLTQAMMANARTPTWEPTLRQTLFGRRNSAASSPVTPGKKNVGQQWDKAPGNLRISVASSYDPDSDGVEEYNDPNLDVDEETVDWLVRFESLPV